MQQALRSATVEDLMEMGELEAHLQRGNAALETKSQHETFTFEPKRQKLLEFEPKLLASSPVKLNVGGTYFATSLDNLTKEPGTFFAAMFSGKWDVKTDPYDKAVFVDRSPLMFAFIIDYLRTGEIDFNDLSSKQFKALHKEVDFYQIASLLKLLQQSAFSPETKGTIQLIRGNSCATNVGDRKVHVHTISLAAFSPSLREMKVKLIKGSEVLIGVAPKCILEANKQHYTCGWHAFTDYGCLFSQDGDFNKPFGNKIYERSVITVKLDEEFNISFRVNREDWGVAFPNMAKDYSVPLHLSVGLYDPGDAVEMLF